MCRVDCQVQCVRLRRQCFCSLHPPPVLRLATLLQGGLLYKLFIMRNLNIYVADTTLKRRRAISTNDSFSGAFSIVFPCRVLNVCGMRRTSDMGEDGRVSG